MVLVALVALGAGRLPVDSAHAQDEVRNYRKPILTVETGGHHARVRRLVWQDNATLLSGGEDKVVKVWNLQNGGRVARSIRPPIWRGPDGTVYAIAMSRPDADGQSYLAVGGFGVESRRGDLTVFRMPGLERIPTGEVVARLLPPQNPAEIGHPDSVLTLAFDPSGRMLASGGLDGQSNHQTVILWVREGETFRPRTALGERERIGSVRALAFSPNGRLATGGADGVLRLWDVDRGVQVGVGPIPDRSPINTLAFSPDGRSIVVGHEGGGLFRFDVANLGRFAPVSLGTRVEQGPVEAVAWSPDGRFLAVSIKSDRADTIDPMSIACDLEIRAMPAGNFLHQSRLPGLIYALAFSPGSDRLAYSAGAAQAIYLQDMTDLQKAPDELRGQGSTPFDLGFSRDSQVVGFTRSPYQPTRPPSVYDGFDYGRRKPRNLRRDDLTFALRTYNGWSLDGSIRRYVLELVSPEGRRTRLDLDLSKERNWWSWTFLPPAPDHPRPAVAVGCESGVVVYDLASGQRTRVFAGHSSPVVSLVPSPDGRWLASSSLDQTIMLYRLSGCDARPGLGAGFRQLPDRSWQVARIDPGGFAAGMGLQAADVIVRAGVQSSGAPATYYNTSEAISQFVTRVDRLAPHLDVIAVWARRMFLLPPPIGVLHIPVAMQTTKRDSAALSLMLGEDREWIVWTPQGYYDTSIEGDSRYLGWHINADYRLPRPTDFFPIGTYAATMFQPSVVDRIWRRVDIVQAESPQVYSDQPPRIVFTSVERGVRLPAPGVVWMVSVPRPKLGLKISAEGPTTVARRRVIFDERLLDIPPLARPSPTVAEDLQVDLVPGRRVRLAVEAANQNGKQRTETIDLVYEPPPTKKPPAPTSPGLVVVGIGCETPRNPGLPAVPFADRDTQAVTEFLSDHLVSADGARGRQDPRDGRIVLTGEKAFTRSISQTLDQLEQRLQSRQFQKGDILAVVINAHVLDFDTGARIATPDTVVGATPTPGPMVPARDVSDLLGRLADYGCRVMVFLDGVHDLSGTELKSDIKAWVRELRGKRRVITFVASKEGPSLVDATKEHGMFAQGILDVFQSAGAVAARKDRAAAFTIEQFRKALHQGVHDLSGRFQEADAFIPPEVDPRTLFAQP
jgi:WD40 repeat protein